MNLRQLYYFYVVAEEGQFTRAAKRLHMAQPPLSQAVQKLEESLGVLLFDRKGRSIQLTDAGKILEQRAKQLFLTIDNVKQEVLEVGQGMSGCLTIGCVKSCFSQLLERLESFQTKSPDVLLKVIEGDTSSLTQSLINHEADLAFVRLPVDLEPFHALPLAPEEYVAVVPEKWYDSFQQTTTLEELADYPLLLLHRTRGVGQYEAIVEQFEQKKLDVHIVCESPSIDVLLGLASGGFGITIVPKSSILPFHRSFFKLVPIENMNVLSDSAIIWLKEAYIPKSAERFIHDTSLLTQSDLSLSLEESINNRSAHL